MKRGFTIIEILVVIGIIAILTVIIFPSVNNIRSKNRDAERVADLASIQLGLSMYYNQHASSYPANLDTLYALKYITFDSKTPPTTDPNYQYKYVPLRVKTTDTRCSYYHLGAKLELPSAQIDTADNIDSTGGNPITSGGYYWCPGYLGLGIAPGSTQYNVHP